MATREQFRRFISAVIDDRLMQRPKRRSRIGGDIFNAKRFDDVEHEVRSGPIRDIYVGSRWRRTGPGSSVTGLPVCPACPTCRSCALEGFATRAAAPAAAPFKNPRRLTFSPTAF